MREYILDEGIQKEPAEQKNSRFVYYNKLFYLSLTHIMIPSIKTTNHRFYEPRNAGKIK